jgi:hypothetical protein
MGELSILRKVPQMLAAGWGGVGRVGLKLSACLSTGPAMQLESLSPDDSTTCVQAAFADFSESFNEPRYQLDHGRGSFGTRLSHLLEVKAKQGRPRLLRLLRSSHVTTIPTIEEISRLREIPPAAIAALQELVAQGHDEGQVVAAFLRLLIDGPLAADFDRTTRRLVLKLHREANVPRDVSQLVQRFAPNLEAMVAHGTGELVK